MNWLEQLFSAELTIGSSHILWREIVGNAFGFASAIGGMRRRVWAWPVGIVGNVLLFTVFFGVAFSNPQQETLYGQAGRQIFFIITSVYGWWRWNQVRAARHASGRDGTARIRRRITTRRPVGRLVGSCGRLRRPCGRRAAASSGDVPRGRRPAWAP